MVGVILFSSYKFVVDIWDVYINFFLRFIIVSKDCVLIIFVFVVFRIVYGI